jgi:hypothetical protein
MLSLTFLLRSSILSMSQYRFQFEYFPNEILIDIFQYFNTRDLFRAFYNLNIRLNKLIQSLNHLSFSISKHDQIDKNELNIFYPFLNTLFIDSKVHIDLNWFTNIRRLILMSSNIQLMNQLNPSILPSLEHLSLPCTLTPFANTLLHREIFSNGFPELKSCCLSGRHAISASEGWTQSLSLRILKIGRINLHIYKAILSACSNLYFLQMNILALDKSETNIEPHVNLKRLKIRVIDCVWSWENFNINQYLLCVPNLERLSVRITTFVLKIEKSLRDYDWFASIIMISLPLLSRFYFYVHSLDTNASFERDIFNRIEKDFHNAHQNRYRSQLIIVRIT